LTGGQQGFVTWTNDDLRVINAKTIHQEDTTYGDVFQIFHSNGSGSDVNISKIMHSGNNLTPNGRMLIQSLGNLDLSATGTISIRKFGSAPYDMIKAIPDGAVELFYNNSKVAETVSGGFTVTGELAATGGNSTNWNTAYGWGDHGSAGYLTSHQSLSGYATESYVGTAISNLVDSAPTALDTLNELASALGDDANFSTTITTSIGTKLPLAGGTLTGTLNTKTLNLQNHQIYAVNNLRFNDAGVNEGIKWDGGSEWQIYESPNNQTNAAGFLQFTSGSGNGTRRATLDTSGNLYIQGALTSTGSAISQFTNDSGYITSADAVMLTQ